MTLYFTFDWMLCNLLSMLLGLQHLLRLSDFHASVSLGVKFKSNKYIKYLLKFVVLRSFEAKLDS
jgi:hypothetical protein